MMNAMVCSGLVVVAPMALIPAALADGGALEMRPGLMMASDPEPTTAAAAAEAIGSGRPTPWTVQVGARAWYVAPAGDVQMPGSSGKMSLGEVNADEPQFGLSGQVDFQAERLLISFRASHVDTDATGASDTAFNLGGMAVAAGDSVRTEMSWTCLELAAGWLVFDHDFQKGGEPDPTKQNQINIWALGGARMYDYSFDVTRQTGGGATVRDTATFGEIYIGARMELRLYEQFTADLEMSFGGWFGSREAFSFDVMPSLSWRPCETIGVHLGYRLLLTDTNSGSGVNKNEFDGSFAGLFAGVVVRF